MTMKELKASLNNKKENNITYIKNEITGCENEWTTCFVENALKNSIGLDYAATITGIDVAENSMILEVIINNHSLWIDISNSFSVECDVECMTWKFGVTGFSTVLAEGYCVINMDKCVVIDSDK